MKVDSVLFLFFLIKKIQDGTIVRPTRKKGEVKQEDEQMEEESEETEEKEETEVKHEFEVFLFQDL